jgi:hypothetical protein
MFLLPEHEIELSFPWFIVSFRDLYVSPKDDARMFAQSLGPRLRLKRSLGSNGRSDRQLF